MRTWAVVLIVALVLGSGCLGGNKAKATGPPTSTDPNQLPPGVTNILEGTVTSSDLTPLAGANVSINGLGWSNLTDAAGYYRFESVPPKDYVITAVTEGYRPKPQRAIIADDAIFQLDFALEEIPLEAPRHQTSEFAFQISCEIAYQTTPDNPQHQSCVSATNLPENKQVKDFTIDRAAAQVQAEFVWTKQTEGAKMIYVTLEKPGESGVQFAYDKGESPLKVVVSQSLMKKNYAEGGVMRATVNAAAGFLGDQNAADVGFMVQQRVDVYFTVFYIEPGPPNFSPRGAP